MVPEVAAAGVMAASSLLGGGLSAIMGSNQSKANRHEARRQFIAQMDYAKNQTQYRVQDALKAGINPLAALGVSANVSPTISAGYPDGSGDAIGNAIASAGDAIGKGILGKAERKEAAAAAKAALDKANDDAVYDSKAKELSLEEQRLKNRILKQQLTGVTNRPGQDIEPAPSMTGEKLLFNPVYDVYGRPRLVINQDALEADADNPGYVSSIITTIANGMKDGLISANGDIKSDQLRMQLDQFYYDTTGHHIKNLESLYISPAEAAAAAAMLARGVS